MIIKDLVEMEVLDGGFRITVRVQTVTPRVGSVWYLAQFGAFAPTAPRAWSKACWSLKRPVLVKGFEI